MLLTNWKTRLIPPEVFREIDAFRSELRDGNRWRLDVNGFPFHSGVDKAKGRIDWTTIGLPPPLPPTTAGEGSSTPADSATKPQWVMSQPLYLRSMPWRLYAYYHGDGLALFLGCDGPNDGKWHRMAKARTTLYAADGGVIEELSFGDYQVFQPFSFSRDEIPYLWGYSRFATVDRLKREGCYIDASGSVRVSAEITVHTEIFPTQETLSVRIVDFTAFVNDDTEVCSTPVMIYGRPLVLEVGSTSNYLSFHLLYNDSIPLARVDEEVEIIALCDVDSPQSVTHNATCFGSQLNFFLRGEELRHGDRYFAAHQALLDPANGCVKKDGSIELKAIILAKHGKWGELYR